MTAVLRERYTRLLRWYPAADRADRGAETVETYMDLARNGQRWPRPGDVVDLMTGGLRQHLRARNALGLADALPIAGTFALMTTTVLAAVWMTGIGLITNGFADWDPATPSAALTGLAWISWLLAPLAALAGYGRWVVAVALTMTTAMLAAAASTSLGLPEVSVLAPQVALGMVALAAPNRRSYRSTAVVVAPAIAAAALAVLVGPQSEALPAAGLILTLATIVTGVVLTSHRDRRAWWPAVVLLGPVLLLHSDLLEGMHGTAIPLSSKRLIAIWTLMSLLIAVAVLMAAMTWKTMQTRHQTAGREQQIRQLAEQTATDGNHPGERHQLTLDIPESQD
ncbi:hypothetical protein [Krasilnikovia sp. MM14-A1259]|uniref:hypothetical protein n=1 Tax=Krasilnikovia sp. MM14-A1259 TaxID=3373539 RepID=UPI0038005BB5